MTPATSSEAYSEVARDDTRVARAELVEPALNHQEHPMTPPPAACTTAAAIRTEALAPALDLIAIGQTERTQLAQAMNALRLERPEAAMTALRRIAGLYELRDAYARRIAGFVDAAADRLDYAERTGSYDTVVSDVRNGRQVAARLRAAIETLADDRQRPVHERAREDLRALFVTFGDEVFASRIACHLGKQRTLAMRGEFTRWQDKLRSDVVAGGRAAEGSRIVAERIAARRAGA